MCVRSFCVFRFLCIQLLCIKTIWQEEKQNFLLTLSTTFPQYLKKKEKKRCKIEFVSFQLDMKKKKEKKKRDYQQRKKEKEKVMKK